ncbi:MFS family permease [Streptomyces sp. V4I2]|nr:MFS family permease [Streptomyces sp. V4I2]
MGYLEILRARHAARLLVGTFVGRLPNATAAIVIVLFVRAESGSYSLAGALVAVYGVANAVGQPVLGQLVDLHGQPRVQLSAAVLSALAMAAFAGTEPLPLAYAVVAAAGLFTPPLDASLMNACVQAIRDRPVERVAFGLGAGSRAVGVAAA